MPLIPVIISLMGTIFSAFGRLIGLPLVLSVFKYAWPFLKRNLLMLALWLGFTVTTYVGVDVSIGHVESLLMQNVNSIPANLYQWFVFFGGKDAITMILSVTTSVLTFKSAQAGFKAYKMSKVTSGWNPV